LAQAIARAGGLQDQRADAVGVFVFRFEEPEAIGIAPRKGIVDPEGKVPVVYHADLRNPITFLVAQGFPIHNKDVLYVSNAPIAEAQKILNMFATAAFVARGFSGGSLGF